MRLSVTVLAAAGLLLPVARAGLAVASLSQAITFEYTTQATCDVECGGSGKCVLSAKGETLSPRSRKYCACVLNDDLGRNNDYACVDPSSQNSNGYQASCYTTTEQSPPSDPNYQQPSATCGTCNRNENAAGVMDYACQEYRVSGSSYTSGYCWQKKNAAGLYVKTSDGSCGCYATGKAPSGWTKCPSPKAGGQGHCHSAVEKFGEGFGGNYSNRGPGEGCTFLCNKGLHPSPSEKPITCCAAGYRSDSAGKCSKSTNGAQ